MVNYHIACLVLDVGVVSYFLVLDANYICYSTGHIDYRAKVYSCYSSATKRERRNYYV